MNQIQKLNEKSRQLLKEKGYEISVSFFKGWDRREDSPDYVTLTIKKEDDMMFQTEFRTQIEGESYDEFGDSVVAECLDVRNSQMYVEKKDLLAEKIKKLRDLKSKLNIFHKKEIKALEEECQELEIFKKVFIPLAVDGVYANIPMIEANIDELLQIYEKLKSFRAENKNNRHEAIDVQKGEM